MALETSKKSQFEAGSRIDRTFDCEIRAIDEASYTVEVIVSDASIDRHEEIILPSAYLARIAHYLANPILCWGHPLSKEEADPEDCIGKALAVEVRPEGLWCKFQYAVDANDRAALIWRLVSGGYLKAYSIGGIVHDCVCAWDGEEDLIKLPPAAREALAAGLCWCVITDIELIEVSQVFVGSCRSALLKAIREGAISMKSLKGMLPAAPTGPTADKAASVAQKSESDPVDPAPAADADPPAEDPAPDPAPAAPAATPEPTEEEQFEALLDESPELAKAFAEFVMELL